MLILCYSNYSVNYQQAKSQTHAQLGLFHSRKNEGFVGVVPPCLPPHRRIIVHFRHRGNHGGMAPTKNEIALHNSETRFLRILSTGTRNLRRNRVSGLQLKKNVLDRTIEHSRELHLKTSSLLLCCPSGDCGANLLLTKQLLVPAKLEIAWVSRSGGSASNFPSHKRNRGRARVTSVPRQSLEAS